MICSLRNIKANFHLLSQLEIAKLCIPLFPCFGLHELSVLMFNKASCLQNVKNLTGGGGGEVMHHAGLVIINVLRVRVLLQNVL